MAKHRQTVEGSRQNSRSLESIPIFREINECNAATGFHGMTDLPEFYIFTLEETYPDTRQTMPPYRRGFYQIALLEDSFDATVRLESDAVGRTETLLFFAAPDHVLSWIRGERQRGYIIYFKSELLTHHSNPVEVMFPFFSVSSMNLISLDEMTIENKAALKEHFARIYRDFHSAHSYRLQKIAVFLTALLYDCKDLYERNAENREAHPDGSLVVTRFKKLVWQCFAHNRTISDYATCLNISADYLSAIVKERTGKNARDIVAERVLLEAKRLLLYTQFSVAEIADHLQFSEPSHFARFFRRHTGDRPLAFRRQHTASMAESEFIGWNPL